MFQRRLPIGSFHHQRLQGNIILGDSDKEGDGGHKNLPYLSTEKKKRGRHKNRWVGVTGVGIVGGGGTREKKGETVVRRYKKNNYIP